MIKLKSLMNESSWNRQKIEKLIKDLRADKQFRGSVSDAEAFEVAQGILDDEPGLEKAVKQIYKVKDVAGWLANYV
jgi:hypothetical protein